MQVLSQFSSILSNIPPPFLPTKSWLFIAKQRRQFTIPTSSPSSIIWTRAKAMSLACSNWLNGEEKLNAMEQGKSANNQVEPQIFQTSSFLLQMVGSVHLKLSCFTSLMRTKNINGMNSWQWKYQKFVSSFLLQFSTILHNSITLVFLSISSFKLSKWFSKSLASEEFRNFKWDHYYSSSSFFWFLLLFTIRILPQLSFNCSFAPTFLFSFLCLPH